MALPSAPVFPDTQSSRAYSTRPPAAGSRGLAGLPALLGNLPHGEAVDLVYAWPEGTARGLAFSLLRARKLATDDPFADPFADPMAKEEPNRFRQLAEAMAKGADDEGHAAGSAEAEDLLREWVAADPATACAAILKMSDVFYRGRAVDQAARILAGDDPSAVMDLLVKSGAEPGIGAAQAFLHFVQDGKESFAELLKRTTLSQQEALARNLTELVAPREGSPSSDAGLGDEALTSLAPAALALAPCPARTRLLEEIARRNLPGLYGAAVPPGGAAMEVPEGAMLIAAELEAQAAKNPSHTIDELRRLTKETDPAVNAPAILAAAAPRLLPNLCRTGHVAEAVQVLNRLTDADAWRKSFETVLPYWMDADPAAARTAFNSAPLTALERERWHRHPAFLLHP